MLSSSTLNESKEIQTDAKSDRDAYLRKQSVISVRSYEVSDDDLETSNDSAVSTDMIKSVRLIRVRSTHRAAPAGCDSCG